MRRLALLVLILMAASHGSAAAGNGSTASAPDAAAWQVQDPADDARVMDSAAVATMGAATACRAGQPATSLTPACGAPEVGSAGGRAAPPALEALGASLQETAEHLVVELWLAGLDESFAGAVSQDGTSGAIYTVCWTTGGSPCSERVRLGAMPSAAGPHATAYHERAAEGCNDHDRCVWGVEHEVVPGAPGAIRWLVPRAILANAAPGTSLGEPRFLVESYFAPSGRATWPAEDGVGYGVRAPAPQPTDGGVPSGAFGYTSNYRSVVDASEPGAPLRLEQASAVQLPPSTARSEDAVGDVVGGPRPDLDLQALTILETQSTLTFAVQVATVESTPPDHELIAGFALPSGRYYTWGFVAEEGIRTPYATVCAVPRCGSSAHPEVSHLPIGLTVRDGSPGWVNATFLRSSLEGADRDAVLNSIELILYDYDQTTTRDARAGGASATFVRSGATDVLAYGKPWRFTTDLVETMTASGVRVPDPVGDVAASLFVQSGRSGQFDITYLEAEGVSPTESRVTLAFRDLSSVEVPDGAKSLFYGVGIELEDGRTFMAGFHRERDTGTVPGRQTFLCAQDTLLLSPAKRDPAAVVWTVISGALTGGAGVDVSGTGTAGAVTLFIPHTCFGETTPGPLFVRRMTGGAYVVLDNAQGDDLQQAGMTGPQELDLVQHEEPTVLTASALAPQPPWFAEPFGIEGFWDMLGVVGAISVSGIGVLAVRRRRRLLNRYLAELDALSALQKSDPRACEQRLLELRHRLRTDLMRNRIEHGHYAIVERNVEETLARVRVVTLADAFGDLPHRLLRRLEELLVDGRLSAEDHAVFCGMLAQTGLTAEAKARVEEKLQRWVVQDADDAPRATAEPVLRP